MDNRDLDQAPFGDLLKIYRKRTKITQRQLAQKLGVHYNTIWGWERGDRLPETKSMVLELVKHLRLSDQETHHLLEASLTALSPRWHVPYPRNPFFTGRTRLLQKLHELLSQEQTAALSGLGGIGKTQTALQYVYQYQRFYTAVFWLTAETSHALIASFIALADTLGLPEKHGRDQQALLTAAKRWLLGHRDWLLVVDNVEDFALLNDFLPVNSHGFILFTTRIQSLGTIAHRIKMEPMTLEEGAIFLLRRISLQTVDDVRASLVHPTYEAARAIVDAMGGLPLALNQAGAYIEETGCGIPGYLKYYHTRSAELLSLRGSSPSDYKESVMTTFSLCIEKVAQVSLATVDLLRLCSFLASTAIPEEIALFADASLGTHLYPLINDAFAWDTVIRGLRHFSLVERSPETNTLYLHRLVQTAIRESMNEMQQIQWATRAVKSLNHLLPEGDIWIPANWALWQRYFVHTVICATYIQKWQMDFPEAIRLLYQTSYYLLECARYAEAEDLYQQTLELSRKALGHEHVQTAEILNDLAVLCCSQGRYQESEPLFQQALAIFAGVLGEEHPLILHAWHNLANLYYEQGKYTLAEQLLQRSLRLRERILGSSDPHVAESMALLARIFVNQRKFSEAEGLMRQALSIRRQALSEAHPLVAQSLTHLGKLFATQNKNEQAEGLFLQALAIREQALGPEHPHVAICLHALGDLYLAQGKPVQAEGYLQRALLIREKTLAPGHIQLGETRHSLAKIKQLLKNGSEVEIDELV